MKVCVFDGTLCMLLCSSVHTCDQMTVCVCLPAGSLEVPLRDPPVTWGGRGRKTPAPFQQRRLHARAVVDLQSSDVDPGVTVVSTQLGARRLLHHLLHRGSAGPRPGLRAAGQGRTAAFAVRVVRRRGGTFLDSGREDEGRGAGEGAGRGGRVALGEGPGGTRVRSLVMELELGGEVELGEGTSVDVWIPRGIGDERRLGLRGSRQRLFQLPPGLLALHPDVVPVVELPLAAQGGDRLVQGAEVLQRKLGGLTVVVLQRLEDLGTNAQQIVF